MIMSMNINTNEHIASYFSSLERGLEQAMQLARMAREKGADPASHPEILPAKDLADRVENLVEISGVAQRIRELEPKMSREEAAFQIGLDFVEERIGTFNSKIDVVEGAIRTAVAILTEGVVAAPIEGIARVELGKNDDGTDYIGIYYAGPIRSAGGTAQTISVLVADYVRRKMGIGAYKPRKDEVERYVEEVLLYEKVTNLQYTPAAKEIRLIVENCPICIDGEPTEEAEVSGHRDLDRIETNRVRGGMALVLAEGLALKAPKIKKYVSQLGLDGWEWLDDLTKGIKSTGTGERKDETMKPKGRFLDDIIAGRPVFSHPSRPGGFRLRYGRSRNSGFATAGIHPATMIVFDDFIATGTQMKIEGPGKAAGMLPVDSIEGPTVRLINGDVLQINSVEQAYELRPSISKIIDVGEILINYGDFLENGRPLVPASYCYEWWIQELGIKTTIRENLRDISPKTAFELSEKFGIPLHPKYTYLWHDISIQELELLMSYISEKGRCEGALTIPLDVEIKGILETLLIPHKVREGNIIIKQPHPLIRCLGLTPELSRLHTSQLDAKTTVNAVSILSGVQIMERAPVRIGGRMGRPEKSKKREMRPAVHILFPLGQAGGRIRSLQDATNHSKSLNDKIGEIEVELGVRKCHNCNKTTFKTRCECGEFTRPTMFCPRCNISAGDRKTCPRCSKGTTSIQLQTIDLKTLYSQSLKRLGERDNLNVFKGVLGLISKNKTPEPLEKGILRAKHDVSVFKDGTVRYDLTDLPLTHFKPGEIGVPIEKLKELGYDIDRHGNPLIDENQTIELKPQDLILSKDAARYLLRAANFVDDLLVKYYGVEPYYRATSTGDMVGHLVIGLAPHTSAGVLGRMLGFSDASVGYAHPFFHAAKRRNCFHPDTKIWVRGENQWSYRSIGTFVEEKLAANEVRSDDFGTRIADVCDENICTLSLNCDTNQIEYRRVTEVSSHEAPLHLLIFKTRSGRKIKVTPEHAMLVSRNGVIKKVQASELEVGDRVPGFSGQLQSVDIFGKNAILLDKVVDKRFMEYGGERVYCLTVEKNHTLVASDLFTAQCDGDEDCVMLLMDGLLNFSRSYLPDRRGGKMDAPLVLTTRIDPNEIDSEAHNIDVVGQYPLEFYEATRKYADPKDLAPKMDLIGARLGSPAQYEGFDFTHDTSNIAAGPANSAYKTLDTMVDKLEAQLILAKKIRAVDARDVAERVISSHFLPDLIGNLRAFSRQKVRCVKCNKKFRRPPLSGTCSKCGGRIILTVHEGAVKKYLDVSHKIAMEYGISDYTKQRLKLIDLEIQSLFKSDKSKQMGIVDFM